MATVKTKSLLLDRSFQVLLLLVAIILVGGTVFYNHYEYWGVINSLYFCVTALTTVGFGDFTPHSPNIKLFTVLYILVGVGIILGFVDVIAKHATRRYLKRAEQYLEETEEHIKQALEKLPRRKD